MLFAVKILPKEAIQERKQEKEKSNPGWNFRLPNAFPDHISKFQ